MPVYGKYILEIRETRDGGLTLKQMRDMMGTYSQMPQADNYSQYSLIIWLVWLSDWVLEVGGCEFESHYAELWLQ